MDDMEYEEREAQLVKEVTEWIAVVEKLKTEQEQYKKKVREAIKKCQWNQKTVCIKGRDKTVKYEEYLLWKNDLLEELGLKGE